MAFDVIIIYMTQGEVSLMSGKHRGICVITSNGLFTIMVIYNVSFFLKCA